MCIAVCFLQRLVALGSTVQVVNDTMLTGTEVLAADLSSEFCLNLHVLLNFAIVCESWNSWTGVKHELGVLHVCFPACRCCSKQDVAPVFQHGQFAVPGIVNFASEAGHGIIRLPPSHIGRSCMLMGSRFILLSF